MLLLLKIISLVATAQWLFEAQPSVQPISVPQAWAEDDCNHCNICTQVSTQNQVITVPGGSSGVVKFSLPMGGTLSYSTNGGSSYSSLSDGDTVTFSNGNTIRFKATNITDGDCAQVIMSDNVTNTPIGGGIGWNACNIATGCP
jgi:hypothetical protein